MRLLHTTRLTIEQFVERKSGATLVSHEQDAVAEYAVPRYAILSHTWEEEEVIFPDMEGPREEARSKKGWKKLVGSCDEARKNGYDWIWVDTCCIDKTSSAELSEAINSMFRWYQNSAVCYVYLSDAYGTQPVYLSDSTLSLDGHTSPKWYSRGWTLQELIAPPHIRFYSRTWEFVGTKRTYIQDISSVTGVDIYALNGEDLSRMTVARRMTWLADRVTTRVEDMAYCMLGIFDINMPLLYGEGSKAFTRLQEEITKVTDDQSLFAWREHDSVDYYREDYGDSFERYGLLASSPRLFKSSQTVARFPWQRPSRPNAVSTRQGLRLQLLVCKDVSYLSAEVYLALLDCQIGSTPGVFAGIRLRRISGERFVRVDIPYLMEFARLDYKGDVDIAGFDPMQPQDELFDLRLRTSHKDWEPRWVYVTQSALSRLPPGFWIVPLPGIEIQQVRPVHLWDDKTGMLQPLSDPISSEKIGAIQLTVDAIRVFLLFGVFVDVIETRPWCKLVVNGDRTVRLEDVFNEFRFAQRTDKDQWSKKKKQDLGTVYPDNMDFLEIGRLQARIERTTVSATDMYVISLNRSQTYVRR